MATTVIDESRLEAFLGQAVVDLAAAFSAPLVRLGHGSASTVPSRRVAGRPRRSWPPGRGRSHGWCGSGSATRRRAAT
jgi:hypothetical protein